MKKPEFKNLEIDVPSFSDIAFLLIIFFILTTSLSRPMGRVLDELEHVKARIRAKVEHPFRVIKRQFGFVKVR